MPRPPDQADLPGSERFDSSEACTRHAARAWVDQSEMSVAHQRQHPGAEARCRLVESGAIAIHADDGRALLEEALRDGLADPHRSTSHDGGDHTGTV